MELETLEPAWTAPCNSWLILCNIAVVTSWEHHCCHSGWTQSYWFKMPAASAESTVGKRVCYHTTNPCPVGKKLCYHTTTLCVLLPPKKSVVHKNSSFHQILHNHNLWLILTIVTIVILLLYLSCQYSVLTCPISCTMIYRDEINQIKSNQIATDNFTTLASCTAGVLTPFCVFCFQTEFNITSLKSIWRGMSEVISNSVWKQKPHNGVRTFAVQEIIRLQHYLLGESFAPVPVKS
jgi:hypothetical protein